MYSKKQCQYASALWEGEGLVMNVTCKCVSNSVSVQLSCRLFWSLMPHIIHKWKGVLNEIINGNLYTVLQCVPGDAMQFSDAYFI